LSLELLSLNPTWFHAELQRRRIKVMSC
jgi:hypothetical protein